MDTKRSKCSECNVKVGLFGFTCKCKGEDNLHRTFCSLCRIAKTFASEFSGGHVCTFDYKTSGRTQIEKNNPKVQTVKVDTI
jgi:hypothetical protein